MNRDIAPFGLRLPAKLKNKLEESAEKNIRSLNAELVARLAESLEGDEKRLGDYSTGELVDELLRRSEPGRVEIQVAGFTKA